MASFNLQVPFLISSCALSSHTFVPWEKPEIRTRSEKVCGLESSSMPRTNFVPHSGTARLATWSPCNCSGVNPIPSVEENRLSVLGSSKGIVFASMPVKSSNIRIIVGSSWPRISSFVIRPSIE